VSREEKESVVKFALEKPLTLFQDANKEGEKNGTGGRYNSTSKFFSSSSPVNQVNEESKAARGSRT
jgi:hypothetical protein